MSETTIYDLSSVQDSNIVLTVNGKAVNAREFLGSLVPPRISQTYKISDNKASALRRARNQVIVAALMGEDRLYRSHK